MSKATDILLSLKAPAGLSSDQITELKESWLAAQGKAEDATKENYLLRAKLAKANERVKELERRFQPDMFWNSDGDMSFDSLEELFDYYGDCHEGGELVMDCRIGVSLPDKTYRGVYDAENNEWVITEQLRKEQE